MSEMIERVAMAIDPMAWVIPDEDYPAERSRRGAKQFAAISAAKRAIEAMSEPTEEMIEAFIVSASSQGVAFEEDSPPQYPVPLYRAMIEEALK